MHYVPVSRYIVLFGVSLALAETTLGSGCPQTDPAGLPLQGGGFAEDGTALCMYEDGTCIYKSTGLLDGPKDGTCPASLISDGDGNGTTHARSRAPSSSPTVESTSFSIPDSTHDVTSSRTSLGGSTTTSASSAEKTSTGGQTVPSAVGTGSVRKSSLSGGIIAGISVGTATLLVLGVFLILCRRRHKRSHADLNPVVHPELALVPGPPVGIAAKTRGLREQINAGGIQERDTESTLSSRAAGTRQEYLRNKILAAQRVLDAIPGVVGNFQGPTTLLYLEARIKVLWGRRDSRFQALQERIRTLESQLQSQWALGLSDSVG
ncbi:hypothetical protein DFH09DRAFT_1172318 [Mycena vulgaris]|nr:hypothetical protein DFH09DRAFT_1172318 [Mycena vulgaris]